MKEKNLGSTADEINKSADKKIAFLGKDFTEQEVEFISTGILPLDYAIGSGIPKGRIVEVHGLQSSGKTSLCLAIIAAFQRKGLACAFVDAEYSFNFDHAKNFGVSTDDLLLVRPDCGEEAFEAMEKLVVSKTAQLIVVDSVSALIPRPEAEAEYGKAQMGGQARLMSSGMRKLIAPVAKTGAIIIFINQLRMNIMGGQYDPYTLPGGMALRFYSSVMLELHKKTGIMVGEKLLGYGINIKVKKNKVGKPGETCDIQLRFDSGFSAQADILTMAEKAGIVTKKGNTYFFGEVKLGIGQNKAQEFLKANPDLADEIAKQL